MAVLHLNFCVEKEPNLHGLYEEELSLKTVSPWSQIQSRWKTAYFPGPHYTHPFLSYAQ